ncbi:MAG: ABC transporter permease [Gammaproteobacteria bacterium]|jgi:peptide/nickel transport system permease protein
MRRRWAAVPLLLWALLAAIVPWLPLQPDQIALEAILAPPSSGHWLGADDVGRPVLDRLLIGARTSFWVACWVVGLSAVSGTLVGSLAGYFGGLWDRALILVIDIFMAFPGILLAIALAGLLGPGIGNLVFALTLVGWVGYARLARAQVLSVKGRDHVLAARALGTRAPRILRLHLLPLISAPLLVEVTFGVAAVVVAESGLSFLGLGVQPPEASWGSMIRDGVRYLLVAPHLVLAPGMALFLVVLSVNLLGDALRDRLDVRATRGVEA